MVMLFSSLMLVLVTGLLVLIVCLIVLLPPCPGQEYTYGFNIPLHPLILEHYNQPDCSLPMSDQARGVLVEMHDAWAGLL